MYSGSLPYSLHKGEKAALPPEVRKGFAFPWRSLNYNYWVDEAQPRQREKN